jgi:hypothetical protein
MSLDAIALAVVVVIGLAFVLITVGDVLLHRLWVRLWKRSDPEKPRDPWTDRTGI